MAKKILEIKPKIVTETDGDFWSSLNQIEDINTDVGLMYVGNSKDLYQKTLHRFYETLQENYVKMEDFIDKKDIENFKINVHSIKSALGSIGSSRLSEMAAKLETAAEEKDMDYCLTHFPDLLNKLKVLNEKLSLLFPEDENFNNNFPSNHNFFWAYSVGNR
jgi:HPt (histidine-containing phosphotransfer) domain-containing protein